MENCEFVTLISVLACTIARGKTDEELNILSAVFTQLRWHISNDISTKFKIKLYRTCFLNI